MESEPATQPELNDREREKTNRERILDGKTEREPLVERNSVENVSNSLSIQNDLQNNYVEHLKSIEAASFSMLEGVVNSARRGFNITLVLNVSTFILGLVIVSIGIYTLFISPETLGKVAGVVSSIIGLILVISLLFWKGPLDRILNSVASLAQINAISLGLAYRLNQIARVFVQKSISGGVDIKTLEILNNMVDKSINESVKELTSVLPKETAESQVQRLISKMGFQEKKP